MEVLVRPENGASPRNRVIGGSGDHVNSTHLGEVTRQALCLVLGDPHLQITGGEMHLNRYVELGAPFELGETGAMTFTLEQLGKPCAETDPRW